MSEKKDYIEEMLRDEVPLRVISGRIKDVYHEQITFQAIQRHKEHHMDLSHTNIEHDKKNEVIAKKLIERDKATEVVTVVNEPEAPMSEMDELKARINAIEIIMVEQASTATNTTFRSYDMAGEHTHGISYQDIANELHPDKKDIHGQYRAIVNSIKAKMIKEQGLCLSDAEFIGPREEKRKKEREEEKEKMNAAEQAMENAAAEKLNAQNRLAGLGAVGT